MRTAIAFVACVAACTDRPRAVDVRATSESDEQPLELEPTPVERAVPTRVEQGTQRAHHSRDAKLSLEPSTSYGKLDELSAHAYAGDQTPDFVFDLVVDTRLPIRHLYVVVRGHGQQWDTVIGTEPTPAFTELPAIEGGRTWHLGVRSHGKWLTKPDGSLPILQAGKHQLELVANVSGPYTAFEAIVELDDGSWASASTQGSEVCRAFPSGDGRC